MSFLHLPKRARRIVILGAGYLQRHGISGTCLFACRLLRDHGVGGTLRALRLRLSGPATISRFGRGRLRSAITTPHTVPADIIVCVHNAPEDVKRCLESVLHETMPPYHLIIVDDGSATDTCDYLKSFAESQGATLIRNEAARGYTFAANQGLRAATAEILVLLNSDTIVTSHWLDRLMNCLFSHRHIGVVGPLSNAASWQSIPQTRIGDDWAENPLPAGLQPCNMAAMLAASSPLNYPRVGFLNGFCLMLRAAMLKEIGLFDEETFGAGYGEENDLCLRAQAAGWELAVADDAYVFHAQSKSYSHERRQALSKKADDALHGKHGSDIIGRSLGVTVESPALDGLRARATHFTDRQALINDTRAIYEGKRLFFLLPVRHAGGGGHVIINEAEALMSMGINVTLVNFASHRNFFEDQHPGLRVPVHYIHAASDIEALAQRADAMIATLFLTVEWMTNLTPGPTLAYYVQDYEPWFFSESDAMHAQAVQSYTLIPDCRLITKSEWNRQELLTHTGRAASVIGPSYSWRSFFPSATKAPAGGRLRVAAMIRPATPRRAPELTARVLQQLKSEFGDRVDIVIFGASKNDPAFKALHIAFPHTNAGELAAPEVAGLLDASDIFLDFSVHQAMGLTALEAMASGVAVIAPELGGAKEFITHAHNGLLVDTSSEAACMDATRLLVQDHTLRIRLQKQAPIDAANYYPEAAARKLLDALFLTPNP